MCKNQEEKDRDLAGLHTNVKKELDKYTVFQIARMLQKETHIGLPFSKMDTDVMVETLKSCFKYFGELEIYSQQQNSIIHKVRQETAVLPRKPFIDR